MSEPPSQYHVSTIYQDFARWDITARVSRDSAHRIGCGSRSDVYGGWLDAGTLQERRIIIKIPRGIESERSVMELRLSRELASWHILDHPNVARFLGVTDCGRIKGLVSPWLPEKSAEFLARKDGWSPKLRMVREIASGLEHLHNNNVVHGDLKIDNIMVKADGTVQIIDFGLSVVLTASGFTTTLIRNPRYTPPELMPITEPVAIRPTFKSDIFSLSMCILEMLNTPSSNPLRASVPYNQYPTSPVTGDCGIIQQVHAGERPLRENYDVPTEETWNLLCECWTRQPDLRPDIESVRRRL